MHTRIIAPVMLTCFSPLRRPVLTVHSLHAFSVKKLGKTVGVFPKKFVLVRFTVTPVLDTLSVSKTGRQSKAAAVTIILEKLYSFGNR